MTRVKTHATKRDPEPKNRKRPSKMSSKGNCRSLRFTILFSVLPFKMRLCN